jgi:hypothetical protein
VPMQQVPDLLDWLLDFLGAQWYKRRLKAFSMSKVGKARVLTRNGVHPLVPGLADYHLAKTNNENVTAGVMSEAMMRSAAEAWNLRFIAAYVPGALSSPKLKGRLKSRENAAALLFEINVAVHYLLQGCTVDLPEIAGDSTIDVLAKFDTYEVEIQCKRKSLGSGRKIPNPVFDRLVTAVYGAWSEAPGAFGIRLLCADRLDAAHLNELAGSISALLKAGSTETVELRGGAYTLSIERIGPEGALVQAGAGIERICRFFDDVSRPPHLALLDWAPGELRTCQTEVNPSYFLCRSVREDQVVDNVVESVREGARQLSGAGPGIVAVHIPEPVSRWTVERGQGATALGQALGRAVEEPMASLRKASALLISGENVSALEGGTWCGDFPALLLHNPMAQHPLPAEHPHVGASSAKTGREPRS